MLTFCCTLFFLAGFTAEEAPVCAICGCSTLYVGIWLVGGFCAASIFVPLLTVVHSNSRVRNLSALVRSRGSCLLVRFDGPWFNWSWCPFVERFCLASRGSKYANVTAIANSHCRGVAKSLIALALSSFNKLVDGIVAGSRFVGSFVSSPFLSFLSACSLARLIGGIVAVGRCDGSFFAFSLSSFCHSAVLIHPLTRLRINLSHPIIVPFQLHFTFVTNSSSLNVCNSGSSWLNFTVVALGLDGGGTTYFSIILIRYSWTRSFFWFWLPLFGLQLLQLRLARQLYAKLVQ